MSRVLIVPPFTSRHSLAFSDGHHRSGRSNPPASGAEDDDRPPVCPVCRKRLVILAMHPGRAGDGRPIRRQLWGCPRGHATAYREGGVFGPFDLLDDLGDLDGK